jgi:hypothetical protein
MEPKRLHKSGSGSTAVDRGSELVCDRITTIEAQKGSDSNWPNEYFKHKFVKGHGKIYRLSGSIRIPSGAHLIYDKIELLKGNGFVKRFQSGKIYGLRDGRLLIKSRQGNFAVVAPYPLWDVFDYPE